MVIWVYDSGVIVRTSSALCDGEERERGSRGVLSSGTVNGGEWSVRERESESERGKVVVMVLVVVVVVV